MFNNKTIIITYKILARGKAKTKIINNKIKNINEIYQHKPYRISSSNKF